MVLSLMCTNIVIFYHIIFNTYNNVQHMVLPIKLKKIGSNQLRKFLLNYIYYELCISQFSIFKNVSQRLKSQQI